MDIRTGGKVRLMAARGLSTQALELTRETAEAVAARLRAEGWRVTITEGVPPYRYDPEKSER
jgi:hypothetical protein